MPTNVKRSVTVQFLRKKALELDNITNQWFRSLTVQGESLRSAGDLVNCVNEIGARFGILGGAVGIVNRATNRLEHWKHFPGDPDETPILPYPRIDPAKVSRLPADVLKAIPEMSESWINRLFVLRRQQQIMGASEPARIPINDSIICVTPHEIRNILQGWVNTLSLTEYLQRNHPDKDCLTMRLCDFGPVDSRKWELFEGRTTFLECIDNLLSQNAFTEKYPDSVEAMFFGQQELEECKSLRSLFKQLKLVRIRSVLRIQSFDKWLRNCGDRSVSELIGHYHSMNLPIVEYFVLTLLWGSGENIYHVVCPFSKTLAYHPNDTPETLSFPGVLLLTVKTEVKQDWDINDVKQFLSPFCLLMRLALEPILDSVFYGSIYKKKVMQEEKALNLLVTSHELKDLVGLIPLADGKPFVLKALRDALLSISMPASGKVDESLGGRKLCDAVRGGLEVVETGVFQVYRSYYEWLTELLALACRLHVISRLGVKGKMPETESELMTWQNYLSGHFLISNQFASISCPESFEKRCFLSVAILCALRNILKHCFHLEITYPDPTASACSVGWIRPVEGIINFEIFRDVRFGLTLKILNPRPEDSGRDEETSGKGTVLAVNYFLTQIEDFAQNQRECTNVPEGNMQILSLPLL